MDCLIKSKWKIYLQGHHITGWVQKIAFFSLMIAVFDSHSDIPGHRGIIRQLQEKYIGKNRKLYFGFVDLEKAFDRVPREVVKWALRKEGVEEWLIKTVMYTYVDARTAVRVGNGFSEDFEVKVGVHQGAVLCPWLCSSRAWTNKRWWWCLEILVSNVQNIF